jgi:HK97 family phage major capsid protein
MTYNRRFPHGAFEQKNEDERITAQVKTQVEALSQAVVEFRAANDERIKSLVKKGEVDALVEEKVDKLNQIIDQKAAAINGEIKKLVEKNLAIEAAMNRVNTHGVDERKEEMLREARQFISFVKPRISLEGKELNFLENNTKAFDKYLRRSLDRPFEIRDLPEEEAKAITVTGDPSGGYLVPPTRSSRIVKRIRETSPMRSIAAVETIGTDRLIIPVDRGLPTSGWVGEKASRTETTTPEWGELEIPVHEQYANPAISQNAIDDSQYDVQSWLADKVAEKLSLEENTAFVSGDGVKKPRGFLSYTTATTTDASRAFGVLQHIATGVSGGWPANTASDESRVNKLIDLIAAMKTPYLMGSRWVMSRELLADIRKFRDENGRHYVDFVITNTGLVFSLFGYPISVFEDMPTKASNSLSVAFGNFSQGYTVVDRQGIRVLVDPFTNKPYVHYYTTKRVGGAVVDSDAIKLLKFATS